MAITLGEDPTAQRESAGTGGGHAVPDGFVAAVDAGVIEEARRRQRRRRRGLAGILAGVAAGVAFIAAVGGAGHGGASSAAPRPAGSARITFVEGRPYVDGRPFLVAVTPALQPGVVGLCVEDKGGGSCNGAYPGAGLPLYAGGTQVELRVGPGGEVDYELAGPHVAAVRVAGLGTFAVHRSAALPAGDGLAVFYRPPGTAGTLVTPDDAAASLGVVGHTPVAAIRVLPLDRTGRVIPTRQGAAGAYAPPPVRYWTGGAGTPAGGRCRLRTTLAGAAVQWGEVSTRISGEAEAPATALYSCVDAWYVTPDRAAYEVGVLLDGRRPGSIPPPLWGAVPLPGHPGVVRVPPVAEPALTAAQVAAGVRAILARRSRRHAAPGLAAYAPSRLASELAEVRVLAAPVLARRVGRAWVIVRNGTPAAQLAFLDTLRLSVPGVAAARG